jgi:hypothetical protein
VCVGWYRRSFRARLGSAKEIIVLEKRTAKSVTSLRERQSQRTSLQDQF